MYLGTDLIDLDFFSQWQLYGKYELFKHALTHSQQTSNKIHNKNRKKTIVTVLTNRKVDNKR